MEAETDENVFNLRESAPGCFSKTLITFNYQICEEKNVVIIEEEERVRTLRQRKEKLDSCYHK